jgi:ribonuclease BN (tRNA processing enzyme)
VKIVGPRGTREIGLQIAETVFPGCTDADFPVDWVEARPGAAISANGLELEPVEVVHDSRLIQCLGYSVKFGNRRFGYTGDTILCDAVKDLARTSDILVSECASQADEIPVHMNLVNDIPQVRKLMKPEAPLILTHSGADVDPVGIPNTFVAEDFKTYKY